MYTIQVYLHYHSGDHISAIDVTLSFGICDDHKTKWSVLEDELRTPHSGILLEVGDSMVKERVSVINWEKFDWRKYEEQSKDKLSHMLETWKNRNISGEEKFEMLKENLHNLVESLAEKKTITRHSRPWIGAEISAKLNELRECRKRFMRHRSLSNKHHYEEKRNKVVIEIDNARERWRVSQCERIAKAESDKEKWKKINFMTNTVTRMDIQPIRKVDTQTNKVDYLFEDTEILREMENYHITKEGEIENSELNKVITELKKENDVNNDKDMMNCEISNQEVSRTFNTCTGAAGPDGIHANLIDNADRGQMSKCLKILWNQAWDEGIFLDSWKEEHRAVLPKPNKLDFHVCDAYRTVSLTAVIGKRYEKITSSRLLIYMDEMGFDRDQFAYLAGRSSTQAILLLIEKIKRARLQKKKVGVIFFDFSDAFGNVNRVQLLEKIKTFGVKGKLFNHIADFLGNRKARIKINNSEIGGWKVSTMGTSAGTVLGPILFIIFAKDIPREIFPKFADDTAAIAIADSTQDVEGKIQNAINALCEWSEKSGMSLNNSKTKVINFSEGIKDELKVNLGGRQLVIMKQLRI